MMMAGLWKDRRARLKPVHQPGYRRDCVGELIQIDGSEHWWFEGRGPQCTLLVYVVDATSRLMHLQFVESESTFDYFAATRTYLERHGKPVAFYSDKHGVFRVNSKDAVGGDGMTQFGRALHALNIDSFVPTPRWPRAVWSAPMARRRVSIRHRPQVAYLSPSRWLSSVRSLRILMRSTRFSIPKSVKAITPSSPTP